MIQLNSSDLSEHTKAFLLDRHNLVSREASFEAQAKKADALWEAKQNRAFTEIKTRLQDMCVGQNLCVYCESNEATDIEHIYPKKLYPLKAFQWENYILACGKCNSHHKKDFFKVFNPINSNTLVDVTCPPKVYNQPPTDDACFVNQRLENPLDIIELDIVNQEFIFIERHPNGTREYYKAEYTIDLLHLNKRALPDKRRQAYKFYKDRLKEYVAAFEARGFNELTQVIDDITYIYRTDDLNIERNRLLESIKIDLTTYAHPTVWKEMIRQRANLPSVDSLLNRAPAEILTWI